MNVLFVNANLYGHINPTLGLVKRLTGRGNVVNYYCSAKFSDNVIQAGARWIGYSSRLDQFLKDYRPTDRHPFFMLMEYILQYDEVMLPEILENVAENQYDMIICDSIFGGACFLKQILKIPVLCSHSSFAMSKAPVPEEMLAKGYHSQLDHCYQILERICESYNIEKPELDQVFTSKGDMNIVYTTEEFNGDNGMEEPEYLFTGPSIDRYQETADIDFRDIGDRTLIYISLGSLNTDHIDFYNLCISAFRDTDYFVCMSTGKKCDVSELIEIPSNFMVKSYFPQLEVLKRAEVFITHAGFNSVNEALYFGVPMLALPQVNDQHMVAKRIVSMHLGMAESMKELSSEILWTKTEALLSNRQVKESCIQISQKMREAGDLEQVVKKMERYGMTWKEKE
ncbi:macrolide family glycosyltransferase [Lacrimispora sp.]|uniref:macrolide family glycosyltransferase n=1 Tax=Lacrimispora sp. TaxID=2719234 RepID=UPI0028B0EBCE|nr:macrolide family glycosyltransferase [Lacrimispora sp.]